MHGIDPADVEFHEVGALDAIVDVVGDRRRAARPRHRPHRRRADRDGPRHDPLGPRRAAQPAAGRRPPARAAAPCPIVGVDTPMELATPTGVAVLVALAERFGPLPGDDGRAGRLRRRHRRSRRAPERRAGARRHRRRTESATPAPGRPAVELEVNVDDVTGEVLAHTIAALLAAGAHDAWATPIVMKKGRPAHTVHALADPVDVERVAAVLLAETGSLGVRATTVAPLAAAARRGHRRRRRPPGARQARRAPGEARARRRRRGRRGARAAAARRPARRPKRPPCDADADQ